MTFCRRHSPLPIHPTHLPLPPECPNPSLLVRKGPLAQREHPRRAPNALAGDSLQVSANSWPGRPGVWEPQPGREGLTTWEPKTPLSKRGTLLKVNPSAVLCRR